MKLISLIVLLYLSVPAANVPISSETSFHAAGDIFTKPRPRRQQTPPDLQLQPSAPHNTAPDQCVLGEVVPEIGKVTGLLSEEVRTEPLTLYVDAGNSAQCSGVIVRWEICYVAIRAASEYADSLEILVLRVSSSKLGVQYEVVGRWKQVAFPTESESPEPVCLYQDILPGDDPLEVEEGDVIAFVSGGRIEVALSRAKLDVGNLFKYPLKLVSGLGELVFSLTSLKLSRLLVTGIASGTPLIRAIISKCMGCLYSIPLS